MGEPILIHKKFHLALQLCGTPQVKGIVTKDQLSMETPVSSKILGN